MKLSHSITAAALAVVLVGVAGTAEAGSVTNEVIFGSGNANGGFTIDQSGGIELGLRAKVRYPTPLNQFNELGGGEYQHLAGTHLVTRPLWSFEWSINSSFDGSGGNLDDYTYVLSFDSDPTAAVSGESFDPINQTYADHAIGTNATPNGGGTSAPSGDTVAYAGLLANNNLAQNSWRQDFFYGNPAAAPLFPDNFDPYAEGVYTFTLTAFDITGTTQLAQTSMNVNIVPEPGSMALMGLGLVGLVAARRRRKAIVTKA